MDLHAAWYRHTIAGLRDYLQAHPGSRDSLVIAAVSYMERPGFLASALSELQWWAPELDRVDVVVVGAVGATGFRERLEGARRVQTGDVPHPYAAPPPAIGASFHDRRTALTALLWREVDMAFLRYSPAHPRARTEVFPLLPPRTHRPLLYGFNSSQGKLPDSAWNALPKRRRSSMWIPEHADYYRYALMRPELDGLLISPDTPAQLASGLPVALARGPLSPDEHDHLEELAAALERAAKAGSPEATRRTHGRDEPR
jgi:hypothetical protein